MSKAAKIGITCMILLAIIPVYVFFHETKEEGQDTSRKNVRMEQKAPKIASAKIEAETTSANLVNNTEVEKSEEPVKEETSPKDQDMTKTPVEDEGVHNDFLVVIDPGH